MSAPRFSIVIPTYNRREYVGQAIESALRQTCDDLEVVVSDNHSTDDTADVVRGFRDDRVRYVRPPEHCVMPDHWEFVRREARGDLVLLLGDDDALVHCALERFDEAQRAHGGDFVFSTTAEYLDPRFPGPQPNTLVCQPFTGATAVVTPEQFLASLFAELRPAFRMDPSAFVFARTLAERVAARAGRFFDTQGAEYFAWPLAATAAERIVHVSLPLVITGRTPKSWGTNMVLVNPGERQIATHLGDVATAWQGSPVDNFTFANLMVEGLLTAKARAPDLLARYEVDEGAYLLAIRRELLARQAKGVDVTNDLAEVEARLREHAGLDRGDETGVDQPPLVARAVARANRTLARALGRTPSPRRGFKASGATYGFSDILGAADVLATAVASRGRAVASAPTRSSG